MPEIKPAYMTIRDIGKVTCQTPEAYTKMAEFLDQVTDGYKFYNTAGHELILKVEKTTTKTFIIK